MLRICCLDAGNPDAALSIIILFFFAVYNRSGLYDVIGQVQ